MSPIQIVTWALFVPTGAWLVAKAIEWLQQRLEREHRENLKPDPRLVYSFLTLNSAAQSYLSLQTDNRFTSGFSAGLALAFLGLAVEAFRKARTATTTA